MPLERKRATGLAVMLATPYVDDLSVFVRVAIERLTDAVAASSANAARGPMPNAAVSGRLASGDNAASPRPNVNARRLMAWCSVITSPFVECGYAIVLVTILLRCLKMLV